MNIKIILTVYLVSLSVIINAQCIENSFEKPFSSKIISYELDSVNGFFEIVLEIEANRNTTYKDSMQLICSNYMTYLPPSSPSNGPIDVEMDSGDVITRSYEFNYDTLNLPFYPKEIQILSLDTNIPSDANRLASAFIYFTPWNTIEIFDFHDFLNSKRFWLEGIDSLAPSRVYIDKNSLPISDLPDILSENDSSKVYSWRKEGMAYSIPMINPDTFDYDSVDLILDGLMMKKDDGCGFWAHKFRGRIENTRIVSINNVEGLGTRSVPIGLRHATVEICVNRWPFQVILECGTDAEGYIVHNNSRIIDFDFCRNSNKDHADIFIRVKLHDQNQWRNFKVEYKDISHNYHQWETEGRRLNRNGDNRVTISFGEIFTTVGGQENWIFPGEHQLTRTYTWLRCAYDISKSEMGNKGDLIDNFNCKVITRDSSFPKLHINIAQYRYWSGRNVMLGINIARAHNRENTHYHEFGHFFSDMIMGNEHEVWSEGAKIHMWEWNNENHHLTLSEGIANAFAFILDQMTFADLDQESNRNRGVEELHPRVNFGDATDGLANLTTPLLSEWIFAQILLDLWDGEESFAEFSNTEPPLFYNDGNNDNFEIPFATIFRPLWDRRNEIDDVPAFFQSLSEFIPSINKRAYKNIIDFNMGDGDLGNNLLIPNDYFIINTDIIKRHRSINQRYIKTELEPVRVGQITNANYLFETNDIEVLSESDLSFNACHYVRKRINIPIYPSYGIYDLTDDLRVRNNASLLINGNEDFGWFNQEINFLDYVYEKSSSTDPVTYSLYNCIYEILETGNLILGSSEGSIGNLVVTSNSELIFRGEPSTPSTLIFHNNSTLIIEEGATLRIGPNTEIILDGPNAVIDIKGSLFIESGACFCPTGGSNIQGFVRLNMPGISNAVEARNRIYLGQDASIQFSGTSSSHKLVEVTDHVLWLDNNADNTKLFSIQNGMIEMGEDAVLNLGIRSVLDHVTITPMSGADDFHGVYLWGHKNKLNHLDIENSRNGLKSYNVVGGYPLLATHLNLNGCSNGLLAEGKGLVYNTGEISIGNSAFGIQAKGMDMPSYLQSVQVNDVDNGVEFTGNKTASLSVTGSTFQVAVNGLDFKSPASLFSRCSNYYGSNTGFGVSIASGNLEMANAFGRSGGGNRFYHTSSQDAFNQSIILISSPVYLHNGINDLKFNAGTGHASIIGRTRNVVSSGYIQAAQNFWALPPYDAPDYYQNIFLFEDKMGRPMPTVSVASPTNHYSLQTTYDNARNSYCAQPGSKGGNAGIGYAMYANPRTITWQTPNQNVKDVFEEILNDQYDTLNTDNLIPDWETALTAPEWNSNMVPVDWYYIDIGINKMNELAAGYLSNDSAFLAQPDSTHNHLVSLKTVLNHWAQRSDTSSDSAAMLLSQHIQFAKASFYTLVNDYAKALTIYTSLASNADSSLFPLAEYWICQLYRMNQIKDTGTHYMFVDSLEPCTAVYPENYPEPFRDDVKTLDVPKPELVMYPNPARNTLNVLFETAQSATIQIIDPIGKVVLEKSTNTHSQPWEIDISSLPAGMYVVKCVLEDRQNVITLPLVKM